MPSDLAWFYSSDDCSIDERFGPLGRVLNEALPLAWKPHKLLLLLIKISVDTMLKIGGGRDLDALLFLLAEHGCSKASDLETGKDKNEWSRAVMIHDSIWVLDFKESLIAFCPAKKRKWCIPWTIIYETH